jgi:hypothetical protein
VRSTTRTQQLLSNPAVGQAKAGEATPGAWGDGAIRLGVFDDGPRAFPWFLKSSLRVEIVVSTKNGTIFIAWLKLLLGRG